MRPILIWRTSRSRSSMVAERFVQKGVWVGDAYQKSFGYTVYENKDIKNLAKRYRREVWKTGQAEPVSHNSEFISEVKGIVPHRQWMMKIGAEFYPAFQAFNPYNIFVFRNIEDCIRSVCQKNKTYDYELARRLIQKRFDYMLAMFHKNGGVCVNTDRLIEGDESALNLAFEYCGIA